MKTTNRPLSSTRLNQTQRGVVLLFALIALLVLMIGAVALVRSFNTTLFNTGNIAFKKDLQNQSERAAKLVFTALSTNGALSTPALRGANRPAQNYSAMALESNAKGIPLALLTNTAFGGVGDPANDISIADQGVTIRYVVDRLCTQVGDETVIDPSACVTTSGGAKDDGSADDPRGSERGNAMPQQGQIIYRLTVRARGPRTTEAYFQSTFAL
jgi:Tfp pilus assembly protein PilX